MLTDTTLLLDLDGVSVARVERLADKRRRVRLVTADETARACPACGVFATREKGAAVTRPRDLPYGESGLESRRHKRRWWCREAGCPRRSFTEQIPRPLGQVHRQVGVLDGGNRVVGVVVRCPRDPHRARRDLLSHAPSASPSPPSPDSPS